MPELGAGELLAGAPLPADGSGDGLGPGDALVVRRTAASACVELSLAATDVMHGFVMAGLTASSCTLLAAELAMAAKARGMTAAACRARPDLTAQRSHQAGCCFGYRIICAA